MHFHIQARHDATPNPEVPSKTYSVSNGPALVYLSSTPDGKSVVYRVDDPESWSSFGDKPLSNRDRDILRALMETGSRHLAIQQYGPKAKSAIENETTMRDPKGYIGDTRLIYVKPTDKEDSNYDG